MMPIEILRHTPTWVFAVFIALLALGLSQARRRSVKRGVLVAIPCAMAIWSVSSLVQGFAAVALVAWTTAYAGSVAAGFAMKPRNDVQYSSATRSFAIPGSWLPLILMMIIFFTRYATGVMVAMQPSLRTDPGFATIVGLVSGFAAGAFALRAIRTLRSMRAAGGANVRRPRLAGMSGGRQRVADCRPAVPDVLPGWARWRDIGLRVALISAIVGLAISLLDRTFDAVPENVLYSESIGLAIFAIYGSIRSRFGTNRRWTIRDHAIASGIAIPSGFFIGMNIASWLTGSPVGFAVFTHVAPFAVVVTGVTSVGFIYFFWSRGRLAQAAAAEADARHASVEAQLKLLQTQIEPHMLFNTLANLRTLVEVDPIRAQSMIDQLIVYLRGTLAASRSETVTLAEEFAQLTAYLALMQVRMATRLRTELILPDALRGVSIAPMLLQPLVENAIKHGLEPKIAGGTIRVEASLVRSMIRIDVEDDGVGLGPSVNAGYGSTHVRERLHLLYGDRALFEMDARDDGGVRVRIELPR